MQIDAKVEECAGDIETIVDKVGQEFRHQDLRDVSLPRKKVLEPVLIIPIFSELYMMPLLPLTKRKCYTG